MRPLLRVTLCGIALLFPLVAVAQTTLVVTPAVPHGWAPRTVDDGNGAFTASVAWVSGPGTPPLGIGSVQLSPGTDGGDAAEVRNVNYTGVTLASLTELSYSTYVQGGGSGGQAPYIILTVDYDNNGTTDDLLFFEPLYQTAAFFPTNPQPAIVVGAWQTWDALNGGWWSVNGTAGAGPGTNVKSLSAIIAAQPNARIVNSGTGLGGLRIVTGFGDGAWDNFVGNVDNVRVGVSGATTIYDFDIAPSLSISDVTLAEGTGGTTNAVFSVTLSRSFAETVTVDFATADGTAIAGSDYTARTGTLTFNPTDTTLTISVPITTDTTFETDETYTVNLSNVSANATVADAQATGTITNDDAVPTISINDISVIEGNSGTTPATFTVTLSNPSSSTITVEYGFGEDTARSGDDWLPNPGPGTLTFAPGVTQQTTGDAALVVGDTTFEGDERFFTNLFFPTNATIGDGQGAATIVNDDASPSIDLSITKAGPAFVPISAPITYTITVTNVGASAATNVVVTDPIPAGTTFVSSTPSQGTCAGTTTVTCSLGTVAAGASATIVLTVNAPAADAMVTNVATVTASEPDTNPANNSSSTTASVSETIPTLSEWMLLALAGLLAAIGALVVKS
jgi:uncharacterized repeat protein (TIGR01451 family)